DLPEQQMHTTAYWLTLTAAALQRLPYASDDRRDGIVGLAFAVRQVAQLLLMCDRHDIGVSLDTGENGQASNRWGSYIPLPPGPDQSARLFIYDNYPGGIGFSEPLFTVRDTLLEATRKLIAECPCESGCPGCVGPIGDTGPLAKRVALCLLDMLLAQ